MNHHHQPPQIPSNNLEQQSSLPSASTANNQFENPLAACCCGGSLPNMTPPYPPERHHFPKTPTHSPVPVLPPLPAPHTMRRSLSDLSHSPVKTSSRSFTSSQDFHFSTDLDTSGYKELSRMNHHHPPQIPSNNLEQESCLPSTANNQLENPLAAGRCGGSLPNMTSPNSPDRYHFAKAPSRSSTSSQDFHFSTAMDNPEVIANNLINLQPAPVGPARASADPTFLLSLMALYLAISIHPDDIVKKKPLIAYEWSVAEICSGILTCVGMEATFYILINWVADKRYPFLLWLALIVGKVMFWISEYGNLPVIAYVPAVMIMNAMLLGSIAVKITQNFGWGMAYRFALDNLGILKKLSESGEEG